ncbi:MAG: bifunctional nicotinamidase/pyrazinamidase [Bacteroidota bacterium]
MKALLLVDLQVDFCALGALEVPDGDAVIPLANQLMPAFDLVVATKDWHPANHGSFAANHPWRKPGQVIDLHGLPQVLWPIHCVQGSMGADFHAALHQDGIDAIIHKGTDPEIDSYSGFFDNGQRQATGLEGLLRERGVEEVYVLGLATDYCVKYTVLDALRLGFSTTLLTDATRGVELQAGDVAAALREMEETGAVLISSDAISSSTAP